MCKAFGGERHWEVPEECKGTGQFAPEAKYRKKLPAWLEEMIQQAEQQARDDQLPLVALTERYRKRDDALVIVRFGDFLAWFVNGYNEEPLKEEDDEMAT